MTDTTVLRAQRWLDIDAGVVRSPAVIVVEGSRITAMNPTEVPTGATEIEENAKELRALVERGMTPIEALRAATVTSAELIQADHELASPPATSPTSSPSPAIRRPTSP